MKRLTADVGFTESDLVRAVDTLSGGERGRLELAKVLVRQPDLLLMDEPTNHLDLAAIERLEAYLAEYEGAFVLVSHDRAFIRAVCSEIVELENGKLIRYPFRYDKYVVERAARIERARAEYERQKEHVDKTEDFIRRNLAGQKTKQAQSRRKMLEKLERLERPDDQWEHAGKIGLSFQTGGDLGGKEIIRAPNLTVGYPGAKILDDVTVNVYRGDKLGVIGPNGSGKSTLLKTLIGELAPLAGKVEFGSGVRIGYFDQKLGTLDEQLTLTDEIRSVRADLSPEAVRQYLAKFRFFGDDPFRLVRGTLGRRAQPAGDGEDHALPAQRAGARRADQPPRHPGARNAGGRARRLRRNADRRQPRSLLPRSHLHPPPGHRGDARRSARRQLQRLAARGVKRTARAAVPTPPKPEPPKPPEARHRSPTATRDGDKRREREQRRLARRVETLEADVSKLEAELAAVRADLVGDHAGDWQKLHALAERERELDALLAAPHRRMGSGQRRRCSIRIATFFRLTIWKPADDPQAARSCSNLQSDAGFATAALHRSPWVLL